MMKIKNKKDDKLIIVYKICVKNMTNDQAKEYINNIQENVIKNANDSSFIHYLVPVYKEYEHPIDVINPNNIKNDAVEKLLEDLLTELTFKE